MSHGKHLKGKKNEEGIKYFIVNQMPDAVKEQRRQNNELIKEAKEKKSRSTQDAAALLQSTKKSTLHQWEYIQTSHICTSASRLV